MQYLVRADAVGASCWVDLAKGLTSEAEATRLADEAAVTNAAAYVAQYDGPVSSARICYVARH